MIRVFAGEFPLIGFSRKGINILTDPIPMTSQAIRTADPTLLKRVANGEAKEIGWIALDDEIEFDPYGVEKSEDKFSEFLKVMPERHWNLVGLAEPTKISILPRLLAREGIDDRTPQVVKKVLEDQRITLAVNKVLSLPQCVIVRRTVMGNPRWRDDGLPISWKPSEAALRAFEE
jgi:CRISPR-associated endonuclease Csn1